MDEKNSSPYLAIKVSPNFPMVFLTVHLTIGLLALNPNTINLPSTTVNTASKPHHAQLSPPAFFITHSFAILVPANATPPITNTGEPTVTAPIITAPAPTATVPITA